MMSYLFNKKTARLHFEVVLLFLLFLCFWHFCLASGFKVSVSEGLGVFGFLILCVVFFLTIVASTLKVLLLFHE